MGQRARLTPEQEALREKLNTRPGPESNPAIMRSLGGLPLIGTPKFPIAPPFRPETKVTGGTQFARQVNELHKLAPELRGRVPEITQGHNDVAIMDIARNDEPSMLDDVKGFSGLRGITNFKTKRIAVNPYRPNGMGGDHYDLPDTMNTMAHEFGHVVGNKGMEKGFKKFSTYESELESDEIGNLAQRAFYPPIATRKKK